MLPTIDWQDDAIVMVDQRKLPGQEIYVRCKTAAEVARAIKTMVIRGAPAIGVAAAFGVYLGVRHDNSEYLADFDAHLEQVCAYLATSRPTAVNLSWALDRMKRVSRESGIAFM